MRYLQLNHESLHVLVPELNELHWKHDVFFFIQRSIKFTCVYFTLFLIFWHLGQSSHNFSVLKMWKFAFIYSIYTILHTNKISCLKNLNKWYRKQNSINREGHQGIEPLTLWLKAQRAIHSAADTSTASFTISLTGLTRHRCDPWKASLS